MKLLRALAAAIFPLFTLGANLSAQSFINLNFEQAVILPDPSSPYYPYGVNTAAALPGWTVVGLGPDNDIFYNDVSLGATSVALFGTGPSYGSPPLDGSYSVDLYGGAEGPAGGASISQTAVVPAGAASIRFIAIGFPNGGAFGGPLLVSLGGQNISLVALSTSGNITTYGGNIPNFGSTPEQLTFNAPMGNNNYWELDDIQFSLLSVPEPSIFALSGFGASASALLRRKK